MLRAPVAEPIYELAGPRVYTYAALLETIGISAGKRPILLPLPFAVWRAIAYVGTLLPNPPITTNQVELMEEITSRQPTRPAFRL